MHEVVVRILLFFNKLNYWQKLERFDPIKPFFVLTGDIDSTILDDKQLLQLETNLKIAKEFKVPYWIFITPDPVHALKALYERIVKCNKNVIIGSHGFKHVSFSNLNYTQQTEQLVHSSMVFSKVLGIEPFAVRTPYLSVNKYTYRAVSDIGFKFDFSTSFDFYATMFQGFLEPRKLRETIFIPLTTPSDTSFYKRNASWRTMSSIWIEKANAILAKRGVISFLVHPGAACEETPLALEVLLEHICGNDISILGSNEKLFEELIF